MNTQTQSNQPPSPPVKEKPLPSHIEKLISLTASLEATVEDTLVPDAFDSEFGKHVDIHALIQQCALVQHLNTNLEVDALDHRSATNLRHTLALIEKTRARQERNRLKELGHQLRESALQPERDEARHFLQTELSNGERPASDLLKLSRSIGIAPATLRRAKASLGITSIQRHNPDRSRCWMWSIPAVATNPSSAPSDASQDSECSTASNQGAASEVITSAAISFASKGPITPASSTSAPSFVDASIPALVPPVQTGGVDLPATPTDESTLHPSTTLPDSAFFSDSETLPSSLHPAHAELLENHFSGDQVINQKRDHLTLPLIT